MERVVYQWCTGRYWSRPGGGAVPACVSKVTRCTSARLNRSFAVFAPQTAAVLSPSHRHSHGGQRKRERHRRGGQQLGHTDVHLRLEFGQTEHSDLPVPSGGADEPPGLAAAGEQSSEDRAGDVQTQVQSAAGGEPGPPQS